MSLLNRTIQVSKQLTVSPIQPIKFKGIELFVKRDDLLNPYFSGNKARKFGYFLDSDLPKINKIISYGSVQANSLYSLAALANMQGWKFDYYVQRLPKWIKENPIGNYAGALALGVNIIEVKPLSGNVEEYLSQKLPKLPNSTLFIPEGGRSHLAKQGIKKLADELINYIKAEELSNPIIMLPSGTGTTALFLQLSLPYQVLTCACVGGEDYLKKQFAMLEPDSSRWPTIISSTKKYHFGKLYLEFYQIWMQLLKQTHIEFDLLYDPLGWITLLNYLDSSSSKEEIIYIHQGGVIGNESMLPRYQRKNSQQNIIG